MRLWRRVRLPPPSWPWGCGGDGVRTSPLSAVWLGEGARCGVEGECGRGGSQEPGRELSPGGTMPTGEIAESEDRLR